MSKFLQKYRIFDMMTIAVMAALGIAIKPIVTPIAQIFGGPFMILGGAVAGGLYMMWLVIGYGIVGKPGTATLIGLVQALFVMFSGSVGSHGILSLITYLAPGIVMDLVLLLIKHRVCCRFCSIIAGASANVTGIICVNLLFFHAPALYLVLTLFLAALSGGICGAIAWELIKILNKYHIINKRNPRHKKDFERQSL